MTTPGATLTWASFDDLPEDVIDLHEPAQWDRYLSLATDILYSATGRRWRGGERTAAAVLRSRPPAAGEPDPWPWHRSWGICGCHAFGGPDPYPAGGLRAHPEPFRVRLPHPDVTTILSVTTGGAAFTAFRLDGPWLVRTDGRSWPVCGDTTEVTYRYGRTPPAAGIAACVELASELGKAAAPNWSGECRLPERVRSVSRQGITMDIVDPVEFLDQGKTGILSIDLFIRSWNPYGRAQEAQVWSPDLSRARRTS